MDRHIIRTTPGALLYQGHAEWYVYAMFADNVCLLALKLVVNITILSTSICSNTRPILSTEHLVYGHVWIRPHYDPYTLSYYLPKFNYPTCVEREETKKIHTHQCTRPNICALVDRACMTALSHMSESGGKQ